MVCPVEGDLRSVVPGLTAAVFLASVLAVACQLAVTLVLFGSRSSSNASFTGDVALSTNWGY